MFERENAPKAAVGYFTDDGVDAVIGWALTEAGSEPLHVWTPLVSTKRANERIPQLIARRGAEHVTGQRGSAPGHLIAFYPGLDDIGFLMNETRMKTLAVVPWGDSIAPWVRRAGVEILPATDIPPGIEQMPQLKLIDPVVVTGMEAITLHINHNNSITGQEKDVVVPIIQGLHDAGYELEPLELEGWAIAKGWRGSNPAELRKMVTAINTGKRPRARRGAIRADIIDQLRSKAEGREAE